MKIAIPLFKERVAPHFGAFPQILLVEIMQTSICQEPGRDMCGKNLFDISRRLVNLGVEKVICGGIPIVYKEWLIGKGIIVQDNRKGEVREIIQELLKE